MSEGAVVVCAVGGVCGLWVAGLVSVIAHFNVAVICGADVCTIVDVVFVGR